MSTQPMGDEITHEMPEMPEAPPPTPAVSASGALLGEEELSGYRTRWENLQVRFVDDPRGAVEEADGLVADLMQRLAETFADERASLEARWEEGADATTEDLRVAIQRYRTFFTRLLAA